jgi:DNA-binding CsgD family transcriptional regulator
VLEAGFDALALLNIGLVMCSATGQVLGCNAPAQVILNAREGLEQETDGTLTCTEPAITPLAEIVQDVAKQNFSSRQDVILPICRAASRRPLTVFLRACSQPSGDANVAVLVMIFDSGLHVRAIDSDLRQLYGFTSTEARLANLLMEGQALETCCEQMSICRSTGCTHLRRLFKKTGAHRQGELVALLLKGIGLARMTRPKIGDGSEAVPVMFDDPDRKIARVKVSGVDSEG